MSKLTPEDIIERAKAKEFINSARKIATRIVGRPPWYNGNSLIKAFEEVGCSCHTDRAELQRLTKEKLDSLIPIYADEMVRVLTERIEPHWSNLVGTASTGSLYSTAPHHIYQSVSESHPLNDRIQELVTKVRETDLAEHPVLNSEAIKSRHFFSIWLLEQPVDLLLKSDMEIMEAYAAAWIHEGWRPKKNEEVRT